MKRITLSIGLLFIFFFVQAQEQSPWYFTFNAGKELSLGHTPIRLDENKSSLLKFGIGYEHILSPKWSLMAELQTKFLSKRTRFSWIDEDGEMLVLKRFDERHLEVTWSIPLYLKYKLTDRLSLTTGATMNLLLLSASKYGESIIHQTGGSRSSSTYTNGFSALYLSANIGLQYKVNNQLDLRLDVEQPFWGTSFQGDGGGSGFFIAAPQISAGINYKFGKKQ